MDFIVDSFDLDAITLVHLPNGPSAYFKLTSIELTRQIYVRADFFLLTLSYSQNTHWVVAVGTRSSYTSPS